MTTAPMASISTRPNGSTAARNHCRSHSSCQLRNRTMRRSFLFGALAVLRCRAQARDPEAAPGAIRAENEDFLRQYAETYRFSLGRPRGAQVTPDGSAVLFLRSQPRS